MQTSWAYDPEVPLLHQVYQMVRSEILDGLYIGRDDFPGEIELAERFNVSVATTRRALQRLDREGMISRGRGRRTQVLFCPPKQPDRGSPDLDSPGTESPFTYVLLEVVVKVAPWEACQAFDMPAGSELWHCTRLRLLNDKRHSVTMTLQPVELGELHSEADLKTLPMPKLLSKIGLEVMKIDWRYSIAIPPPDITTHLGTEVHEQCLLGTVVHRAADSRPLQWSRTFHGHDQPSPWGRLNLETGLSVRDTRLF